MLNPIVSAMIESLFLADNEEYPVISMSESSISFQCDDFVMEIMIECDDSKIMFYVYVQARHVVYDEYDLINFDGNINLKYLATVAKHNFRYFNKITF